MTPEQRADEEFGKHLGCTWRYSRMRTEITRVITEAEADARADEREQCAKRAVAWYHATFKRDRPAAKDWRVRELEAAIRNSPGLWNRKPKASEPPAESEVPG